MECHKGDVEGNLAAVGRHIQEAKSRHIDILAFPEMNVTGYVDPVSRPEAALTLDDPVVGSLREMTGNFEGTVLAGIIEKHPEGRKPFITALVIRRGKVLGLYRKNTIEGEEAERFSAGNEVPVFDHDGLTFGVAICADINNESVFASSSDQGARVVFELAAPGLYGDQATRNWQTGFAWWRDECEKHLGRFARVYGLWIAVATQAGRTVDEDFPGGGYVFAPSGKRIFATGGWLPCSVFLAIDLDGGGYERL